MSNGYLLAAQADLGGQFGDVASGFGLRGGEHDRRWAPNEAAAAAMQGAANVGIVLSQVSDARRRRSWRCLHVLARSLRSAQLILAEPDASR
jgi:hypothetical protein